MKVPALLLVCSMMSIARAKQIHTLEQVEAVVQVAQSSYYAHPTPSSISNSTARKLNEEEIGVFWLGVYGTNNYSSDNFLGFNFVPWTSLLALRTGIFSEIIPNSDEFIVEFITHPKTPKVLTTEDAAAAVPEVFHGNLVPSSRAPPIHALAGDRYAGTAKVFASLMSIFKVPHVAHPRADELSQKTYYPYFVRTESPVSSTGATLAQVALNFNWYVVTLVIMDVDNSGVAVADAFVLRGRQLAVNFTAIIQKFPEFFDMTTEGFKAGFAMQFQLPIEDVYAWADIVAVKEPRIMFVSNSLEMIPWIIYLFLDHVGLFGDLYSHLLYDTFQLFAGATRDKLYEDMKNDPDNSNWDFPIWSIPSVKDQENLFMGGLTTQMDSVGPFFYDTKFQNMFKTLTVTKLEQYGGFQSREWDKCGEMCTECQVDNAQKTCERAYFDYWVWSDAITFNAHFDCFTTIYSAISRLLLKVDAPKVKGKLLLDFILKSDFPGTSGRVKFDEKGDRQMSMFVMQIMPQPTGQDPLYPPSISVHPKAVAYFDATVMSLDFEGEDFHVVRFFDGSTTPASDTKLPCTIGMEYVNRQTDCADCNPGRYNPVGNGECLPCAAGTFTNTSKRTGCTSCKAGSAATEAGQPTCPACPAGTFAPSDQAFICISCEMGTFTGEGSTKCKFCPRAFYTDVRGKSACDACRADMTTLEQAETRADACVCDVGAPLFRNSTDACITCPVGLVCPIGTNVVWTQVEYMVVSIDIPDAKYRVFACSSSTPCPGGMEPDQCAANFDARACGRCMDEYYEQDNQCYACSGAEGVSMFCLAGLAGGGIIGFYYVTKNQASRPEAQNAARPQFAAVLIWGLLLSACQIYSVLGRIGVDIPKGTKSSLDTFKLFAFEPNIFGVDCLYESDINRYFLRVGVPFAIATLVSSAYMFSKCLPKQWRWKLDPTCNAIGTLGQALLIPLVSLAIEPFRCFPHPERMEGDADGSSLVKFPDTSCYVGDWYGFVVVGLTTLFLFVCSFFCVAVYALIKAPALTPQNMASFNARFFFLFSRFRPECWYSAIVFITRNLCCSMIPAISPTNTTTSIMLLQCVIVPATGISLHIQPWVVQMLNWLDAIVSMLLVMILGSLSFFQEADTSLGPSVWISMLYLVSVGSLGFMVVLSIVYHFLGRPIPTAIMSTSIKESIAETWHKEAKELAKANLDRVQSVVDAMPMQDLRVVMKHLSYMQTATQVFQDSPPEKWMSRRRKMSSEQGTRLTQLPSGRKEDQIQGSEDVKDSEQNPADAAAELERALGDIAVLKAQISAVEEDANNAIPIEVSI